MASFGAKLKQEREQRGITLEQISQSTKIGTRFLHALEEEHFDELPGGIFNKGFIRAYARCLGLDEEKAIADYLAVTEPPLPEAKSSEGPLLQPRAETEVHRAASLPWGTFALLLLIVALGFAAWGVYSGQTARREKPAEAPAEAHPTPATASQSQTAGVPSAVSHVSAPAAAAAPGSPAPASSQSSTPSGKIFVQIRAREDSWILITADGKQIVQDTLVAPAEKSVRAAKEVVIKAGNVGALDFEFNGKKLPVQGDYGEVKTLVFESGGWHVVPKPPPNPDGAEQP